MGSRGVDLGWDCIAHQGSLVGNVQQSQGGMPDVENARTKPPMLGIGCLFESLCLQRAYPCSGGSSVVKKEPPEAHLNRDKTPRIGWFRDERTPYEATAVYLFKI
jgi:hypothetical protein